MKRMIKRISLFTALVALLALLTAAVYAEQSTPEPGLVFDARTQLTVYLDGQQSDNLSDVYNCGETATLRAPTITGKSFSHWEADGSVISYASELKLTMNAHTTLYAVYADNAPTTGPVAGFTSITRTDDGTSISLQAIASGDKAGIIYSTTSTGDALTIGGEDVTDVEAVKLTGLETSVTMPKSILDGNNCWMLQITPEAADTLYHARAYVTTSGGTTTYGDEKNVKLSDLQSGVSLTVDPNSFDPNSFDPEQSLETKLANLRGRIRTITFDPNGGEGTMAPQGVLIGEETALNTNTFTREDYSFNGWNTAADGSGTSYADGATVTLSANTTLYAQWKSNSSGDNGSGSYSGDVGGGTTSYTPTVAETKNGKVTVDPKSAAAGAKVTVTVTPDEGYEVDSVSVKDANGKDVALTKNADGTYTYTQPAGKVTVTATFKEKAKETPTEGLTVAELLEMFDDLDPNGWYLDDVRYCVENGYMKGMGEGKFGPGLDVSRAMIAQLLWNMAGNPEPASAAPFDDVAADAWYAKAVAWAYENGITKGTGVGFEPDKDITREQLAAMLYNYAKLLGKGFTGAWMFLLDYPDAAEISSWADEAIHWMVLNGIINGTTDDAGTVILDPQGDATRAQLATMVQRFCEYIKAQQAAE